MSLRINSEGCVERMYGRHRIMPRDVFRVGSNGRLQLHIQFPHKWRGKFVKLKVIPVE